MLWLSVPTVGLVLLSQTSNCKSSWRTQFRRFWDFVEACGWGEQRRGEELLAVDVGMSVQFFSLFHANCEAHLAS